MRKDNQFVQVLITILFLIGVSSYSSYSFAQEKAVTVEQEVTTKEQAEGSSINKISQFKGYAYDLKTDELVYTELYERTKDDVLFTEYRDANEQLIATRNIQFKNDQVSLFKFDSKRSAFSVEVERLAKKVNYKRINTKGEVAGSKDIEDLALSVIDAGFNNFVIRHWDDLSAGKAKTFKFFHTGKARWLKLRIKSDGVAEIAGVDAQKFKLRLAMPLLGALIKPIILHYYSDTKELAQYEGISNIKSALGKQQRVRIEFPRNEYISKN